MKKIKFIYMFILISQITLFAGVPIPRTHKPYLPYYMEQINFQPILLKVYGQFTPGIIPNHYGDLYFNPAFILNSKENSAYLDFNYKVSGNSTNSYSYLTGNDMVYPQWYTNTSINSLQLNPLYNFALIQKINEKISIGVSNRFIFDYGPFRSSSNRRAYSNATTSSEAYDKAAYDDLDLKTVEVAENQQAVWGTQTEFSLGYIISPKIDFGLKIGHYIFRQWGELYDTRYSKQPHSLIDEYNNEDFKTNGNQYEIGAGLIYHIDDKTNIGLYASFMKGNSSEKNVGLDKLHNWSENSTDTNYYAIRKYDLTGNYNFSTEGSSPFLSLTFQKELSNSLMLRSFFYYRYVKQEITGSIFSTDTIYNDRTHDVFSNDTDTYLFARDESSRRARNKLNGSGDEIMENYQWFLSLIYKPESEWMAFATILLRLQNKTTGLFEKSSYFNNQKNQRFYYNPRTWTHYRTFEKNYQYDYSYEKWSAIIPVGIKAHIFGGFSFLIGTDLQFDIIKIKESGDLLYPTRTTRHTKNGTVIVEDIEKNRPEAYLSDKPISFNKNSAIHFGAFYEHSSGIKLYVKTEGNILNKSYWTFGLEYIY